MLRKSNYLRPDIDHVEVQSQVVRKADISLGLLEDSLRQVDWYLSNIGTSLAII